MSRGTDWALCWRDESSGDYFRARAQGVNTRALTDALSGLAPNGAQFAFENPDYDRLDPDTLILPQTTSMPVYSVSDPMGDGRDSLETLMGYLNISADASNFYSAGSEQVARSESDSLRLSQSGFAIYEAGEARSGRFPFRCGGPDHPGRRGGGLPPSGRRHRGAAMRPGPAVSVRGHPGGGQPGGLL